MARKCSGHLTQNAIFAVQADQAVKVLYPSKKHEILLTKLVIALGDILKKAECPNCEHIQYVITTNQKRKKKRCVNCGEVRDLKIERDKANESTETDTT